MRVLMLAGDAYGGRGGIAAHNRDVIAALSATPAVTEIVVLPRVMPASTGRLPPKVTQDASGLSGKSAYFRAVLRQVTTRRFDLVHCMLLNLAPIAWMAARLQRVPWLVTIHGVDAWQRPASKWRAWAADRADHVLSVSQLTLDRFRMFTSYRPEQTSIVYNSIHLEDWGLKPPRQGLAESLGVVGKKVILTLGRMAREEQYKGFDEIIEIMPSLLNARPDLLYLIAGDGSDKQRLEEKVRRAGLCGSVRFLGYVSDADKADIYRLADAYVMPSSGEGFGIVFLEALACGLPVVGSRIDGGREALQNGRLGRLVDPGDRRELTSAVLAALAESKRVPDGIADFAFPAFANRIAEVFQRFAEDGG